MYGGMCGAGEHIYLTNSMSFNVRRARENIISSLPPDVAAERGVWLGFHH
ncbi:unnamed protein product [Ectocarpus sp. CCAP 1310/34]|nr:unnamed protein product [Ectocarpus sp. CCAP 1310/34]